MKKPEILLRKLRSEDAQQLAILANNKNIWDNVRDAMPHPYSLENAEAFINHVQEANPEWTLAIEFNGTMVGMIGLHLQNDVYRNSAELGYWIGEPHWGNGIASEAVRLIVLKGFNELDINRIFAGAFEYNQASMKVLEKNGFQREGIAKKAVIKNGEHWDEHRYGLLKE